MEGVGRALAAALLMAAACGPAPARVAEPAPVAPAAANVTEATLAPARGNDRGGTLRWAEGGLGEAEARYLRLATELSPREGPAEFTGKLANWPVTGRVSSPFGPRWGGFHNGLDVAAPMNTPVLAALPGRVVGVGRPYLAYGDTAVIVIVYHGSNFTTLYVHLDETRLPPVSVGDKVAAGQVLGYVGLTGWTTGPHVHFMTVTSGRAVNPLNYLP